MAYDNTDDLNAQYSSTLVRWKEQVFYIKCVEKRRGKPTMIGSILDEREGWMPKIVPMDSAYLHTTWPTLGYRDFPKSTSSQSHNGQRVINATMYLHRRPRQCLQSPYPLVVFQCYRHLAFQSQNNYPRVYLHYRMD